MRGKVDTEHLRIVRPGITPAYAGKSVEEAKIEAKVWDHPRLCGEKPYHKKHFLQSWGSPPPMRGKDHSPQQSASFSGITPAYAGKSSVSISKNARIGDHPRLCGEKKFCPPILSRRRGSPPPMRGKVPPIGTSSTQTRITPAYAGKSAELYQWGMDNGDHPRLCGEKQNQCKL